MENGDLFGAKLICKILHYHTGLQSPTAGTVGTIENSRARRIKYVKFDCFLSDVRRLFEFRSSLKDVTNKKRTRVLRI